MAMNDLEIIVAIKHKGKLLAQFINQSNDDVLDLEREREFNMKHKVEDAWVKAIKTAITNYVNGTYSDDVIGKLAKKEEPKKPLVKTVAKKWKK